MNPQQSPILFTFLSKKAEKGNEGEINPQQSSILFTFLIKKGQKGERRGDKSSTIFYSVHLFDQKKPKRGTKKG